MPVWGFSLLTAMGLLALARLMLLAANFGQLRLSSTSEFLLALLVGLRFDLATALITITLPLLPLWLPFPWSVRKHLQALSRILTIGFFVLMSAFLWGDFFFFSEADRHLTLEPFGIVTDFRSMVRMLAEDYLLVFLLLVIFWVGLAWWVNRMFDRSGERNPSRTTWDWQRLILWLPLAAITFIGVRGGIQKEPLKSADAVTGSSPLMANIALNGWYSFLTEAVKPHRPLNLMPAGEAARLVRTLVRRNDDRFIIPDDSLMGDTVVLAGVPRLPLLRVSPATGSITPADQKLNLVMIVVESLNADYLQSFGGSQPIMPFLDSLAQESVIFTNFQAVGTRSFRGLCALLASYPNLGSDAYRLTFIVPRLLGLGGILSDQGYQTRFMHAAPLNSMGITAICRLSGYKEFVSLEDFPHSADNGSWGAWDHLALERMEQDMDRMEEPFHYGLFTLCTHAPWSLPDGYVPRLDKDAPQAEILNTYGYLDDALRDFFARESSKSRFKNTIYLLVGDHTTHASESERFRVGCIFYAPGRMIPRVDTSLCSQLDILPSTLDLLGIESPHSSFGSSLFSSHRRPEWAVLLQSNLLYWREGNRVLASELTREIGHYDPSDRSANPRDYLDDERGLAAKMNRSLVAVYEVAEMLARENQFTPEKK